MVESRTFVTDSPLSIEDALESVSAASVGGVGLFVGMVRNHDPEVGRAEVAWLEYSAHPSAEERLADSAARVAGSHQVHSIYAAHRVGHLEVGDIAVITAAGGAHRGPALAATQELIDDLKQTVPIWKRQGTADGQTSWVGL